MSNWPPTVGVVQTTMLIDGRVCVCDVTGLPCDEVKVFATWSQTAS